MTDRTPGSPALDPADVAASVGTTYPEAFQEPVRERERRRLGDALGLTGFGVNLVRLVPGAWSSQRHCHTHEDEFVYILEGEATLVTDAGEQLLGPGMAAGFPAGTGDAHHLINRGERDVLYLEVGSRIAEDTADYPECDLRAIPGEGGKRRFVHKDGTPY